MTTASEKADRVTRLVLSFGLNGQPLDEVVHVSRLSLESIQVGFHLGFISAEDAIRISLSRYELDLDLSATEQTIALSLPDELGEVESILRGARPHIENLLFDSTSSRPIRFYVLFLHMLDVYRFDFPESDLALLLDLWPDEEFWPSEAIRWPRSGGTFLTDSSAEKFLDRVRSLLSKERVRLNDPASTE